MRTSDVGAIHRRSPSALLVHGPRPKKPLPHEGASPAHSTQQWALKVGLSRDNRAIDTQASKVSHQWPVHVVLVEPVGIAIPLAWVYLVHVRHRARNHVSRLPVAPLDAERRASESRVLEPSGTPANRQSRRGCRGARARYGRRWCASSAACARTPCCSRRSPASTAPCPGA